MGAIGNTTPTDGDVSTAAPLDRISLSIAACLALALVALALPRVVGELNLVGARSVVSAALENRPDKQQPLSAQSYAKAAAAIATFGGLTGDARLVANRGIVLLRQGSVGDAQSARSLEEALEATEWGLAQNPGNTDSWARLAYLRARIGNPAGAASALRMSMLTAPVSPQLMPSRLRLGLHLLDHLNEEQRSLLARQVRLLWVTQPSELVWESIKDADRDFIADALNGMTQADMDRFVRLHRIGEKDDDKERH